MKAHFKVFRATDDPEACDRYIKGHRQVLEAYGVTKVTSGYTAWKDDPFTYVVIVESEDDQKVYGGCRVQIRTETLKMPLEDAVALLDTRIYDFADALGNYKVAEFCGLWNSKEVAGFGIGSMFLGRVAIAITPLLGLPYLMGLCSPATLRNSQKVGFEIVKELGTNGTFYYPKEDLLATLLLIRDVENLPLANEEERRHILALRNNPVQQSTHQGPKGVLHAIFDISIKNPPRPILNNI